MLPKFRLALLLLLTLGLAGLIGRVALAQEKDAIAERMKKDITFLASDECEGRGVGTLGLDLAAQYVAVQFSHAGLKPGGVNGTYFQPFPFCTGGQLDGESTLTINGPTKGKKRALKQGEDFQVLGSSSSASLTAPVVFAGYGVTARGIAYDDYAGVNVKGKIVVLLRRVPRWNDNERPFDGANKDEFAGLDYKQYRAYAAKAAAVILVNDASEAKDVLIPFAQMSRSITTVAIPCVQMKRLVLDDMLKDGTGKTLAEFEKAIDTDLKPQSVVLKNITMKMNVKVKREEPMVKNVIGYLEGSGPLANETIVVGAHYDHLGYGFNPKEKGKIYHGADDNGSGSTSVIELARRFGAMKGREGRRIVFMTFTAEERGLIGSRHYCRLQPLFPLKDTAAMFNLDMVGRLNPRITGFDGNVVTVTDEDGTGARKYNLSRACEFFRDVKGAKPKSLDGVHDEVFTKIPAKGLSAKLVIDSKNEVTKVTLTATGEPTLLALGIDTGNGFDDLVKKHNPGFNLVKDSTGVFGASDHYSFYQQKIPVLFFWTGFHPDYHRPTDTSDKINVAGMKKIADFSEKIIGELSTEPKRYEYVAIKSSFNPGGPRGPRLGIMPDYEFGGKGARIEDVSAKGPADQAGLKKGDVIIEIAGKAVADVNGYMAVMRTQKSGTEIEMRILRDNKEMQIKVTPK